MDELRKRRGRADVTGMRLARQALARRVRAVLPIVDSPSQDGDQAQGDQHFGNIQGAHMHPPGFDYTPAGMQSLC